ncbi:hypothetical protein BZA77DRAFT_1871 [Pyronema omphalodes]|nr:hypothetical protein BZA77DRAFT_1871 [Pyronema omphalodes]
MFSVFLGAARTLGILQLVERNEAYRRVREQWRNRRRWNPHHGFCRRKGYLLRHQICVWCYQGVRLFFFVVVVSLVAIHRSIIAVLFWPGEAKWSAVDWSCFILLLIRTKRISTVTYSCMCLFWGRGRIDYFFWRWKILAFIIVLCSSHQSIFLSGRRQIRVR